jgi:putative membrane protein
MRERIFIALKGLAMGMAEVVPGVSGGTIAFISGIYPSLMESISALKPSLIALLFKGQFKEFAKQLNLAFLLPLGVGMVAGLVTGVLFISYLLEHYPLPLWAFFFGLILASALYVFRQMKGFNATSILLTLAATGLAYYVTIANPLGGSASLVLVFFSGVIAISAMVLPGLSGSFILLLLGMYSVVLPTVKSLLKTPELDAFILVAVFAGGCLIGLVSFARLMSYAFKKQPNNTLAVLLGFMLGSLNKVWPWQEVTNTRVNSGGETVVFTSKSVLPNVFSQLENNFLYGNNPQVITVILCMIFGFAIVFLLDKFGSNTDTESK